MVPEKIQDNFKKNSKSKPKKGGKHDEEVSQNAEDPKDKDKMISCYICLKDRYAKTCPLHPQKLDVVEQQNPSVGVLQVLNAALEEPEVILEVEFTKLSYVPIELNGQQVLLLLDSGATHNLFKEEVVNRFKLQVELGLSSFKVVNSEVERVVGVTH